MKHIKFSFLFLFAFMIGFGFILSGCAPREGKINRDIARMHSSFSCNPTKTTLDVRACDYDGKY